jgi:SRSO17 transposase
MVPQLNVAKGAVWIIDDTGIPKKGKHSVGVARQYCAVLGKQDNCQVAVSPSLATEVASVPLACRLCLPQEWAEDRARRRRAGVPEEVRFATRTQIALEQLEELLARGASRHCVLADGGYGVKTAFRQRLSDLGLEYMVGITSAVVVWPPGVEPLPAKRYSGMGRPPVMPRRAGMRQPVSVKDLAKALPHSAFRTVGWREGSNAPLSGRFGGARTTCWRQLRSRAAASRGAAADRVARRHSRAAEILPVDVTCGYSAE